MTGPRRTHCAQGHPIEGDNMLVRINRARGWKQYLCRICRNERQRADYRRTATPRAGSAPIAVATTSVGADFGNPRLPDRFWARVYPEPNTGCWLWAGGLQDGYGVFDVRFAPSSAHRVAYVALIGDPGELSLDHLCRVRWCCNPEHLEPVTERENSLRSPFRRRKTHCTHGHEYTPENTQWKAGEWGHPVRKCRTCIRNQRRTTVRAAK